MKIVTWWRERSAVARSTHICTLRRWETGGAPMASASGLGVHDEVAQWNYFAIRMWKVMIVVARFVIHRKEFVDLEIP